MAQKTKKRVLKKAISSKNQKGSFKPHHAKAYRKRHLSLVLIFVLFSALALFAIIYISLANSNSAKSARNLLEDIFQPASSSSQKQESSTSTLSSSYGFSLSYDNQKFYAGALSANKLYIGDELQNTRAYDAIRISPTSFDGPKSSNSLQSLNLQYYLNLSSTSSNLKDLEETLVSKKNPSFKLKATNSETISGLELLITDWELQSSQDEIISSLQVSFRSYTTTYKDHPLIIIVNNGLSLQTSAELDKIARSLSLTPDLAGTAPSPKELEPKEQSNLSLLDKLTFTAQTSAAKPTTPSSAERASMLYSPAVVRIYNFYCMDITKSGQLYISNLCGASAGSGFFVGAGGYIATNGHVVVNEPLDLAIVHALDQHAGGDSSYLEDLIILSGLTEADLIGAKNNQEKSNIIFKALYKIPKSTFSSTNAKTNLLASLNESQPDLEELRELTENRSEYPAKKGIKELTLEASDYRAIDGSYTGEFQASDVALLKIEGQNYPAVKLGNIQALSQGGDINILGFPGAANSSNGLVSLEENRPTLTSGKVSAIKSAVGSKNQLIETDATIGHGNSGGPAFNSSAEVVGIATYTVDGSGRGDGVFNYIRDIADLTTLANNSSIDLSSTSQVQTQWQEGIELFYEGRYSKAKLNFSSVLQLYPEHPRAEQLISLAETRIQAGEEVKDFPWLLILLASTFGIGTLLSLSLIIRHRRKHSAYLKTLQLNSSTRPPQQNFAPTPSVVPPTSSAITNPPTIPPPPQTPPSQWIIAFKRR